MWRARGVVTVASIVAPALLYACGTNDQAPATSPADFGNDSGPASGSGGGDNAEAGARANDAAVLGDAAITPMGGASRHVRASGVLLVHAAQGGAFRLCFGNHADLQPQPDSTVMPDSNVVGVDVGSAVWIPPLPGAAGEVRLFDEELIRAYYPPPRGNGPSCGALLANPSLKAGSLSLGPVNDDLADGAHMLVVTGCPPSTTGPYTNALCGASYDNTESRKVTTIQLDALEEPAAPGAFAVQIADLSPAGAPGGVDVGFGDLGAAEAVTSLFQNVPLLAAPAKTTDSQVHYPTNDAGVYASFGFRVKTRGEDGGAPFTFDESLADVQHFAAPDDVPTTYFTQEGSYVLLVIGARPGADAGADAAAGSSEDRTRLHVLAVPVHPASRPEDAGFLDASKDAL